MDKKAVFLPCRFGASIPQAIGVTRKLSNRISVLINYFII